MHLLELAGGRAGGDQILARLLEQLPKATGLHADAQLVQQALQHKG